MNSDLIEKILKFRNERDWKQFHTTKDLMLGLNIEVGELQELVLWKSHSEIKQVDKSKLENEIADIFIFLTYICDEFKIDIEKAVEEKIILNGQKYPIDESKGSNKKYTEIKTRHNNR